MNKLEVVKHVLAELPISQNLTAHDLAELLPVLDSIGLLFEDCLSNSGTYTSTNEKLYAEVTRIDLQSSR